MTLQEQVFPGVSSKLFGLSPGLLNTGKKYFCLHSNWNANICLNPVIYKNSFSEFYEYSVSTVEAINQLAFVF